MIAMRVVLPAEGMPQPREALRHAAWLLIRRLDLRLSLVAVGAIQPE